VPIVPFAGKNGKKIKLLIKKKPSVAFDKVMSNVYKNNIFPTLPPCCGGDS
jgi:hypothetical protein